MPTLLTQCPFCQTSFKVSEEQMQAANGVVRCGSCMEVFLAEQHRIVLKDKSVVFETADLTDPDPDPDEESPPEAENEASESSPEDSFSPEESPEEDEPADPEFFPETANEDPEEIISSTVFEEDDLPKPDGVLVFGPWSDKEAEPGNDVNLTSDDDSDADQDSHEEAAEADISDDSAPVDDQEAALLPWQKESSQASAIIEQDIGEETSETAEEPSELADELAEEVQSPPKDEPVSGNNFASYLNPGGYSMRGFSVDHILPPQESKANMEGDTELLAEDAETLNEAAAEANEFPEDIEENQTDLPDRIGNLESLDASMDFTEFRQTDDKEDIEADFEEDLEEKFDDHGEAAELTEEPPPESIPTLVPDLVATESIPAGMDTSSMAWLQSVPEQTGTNPATDYSNNYSNDYTGAEDKAVIISNLSELEDEESLAPLAQENLEAIDEEPVELIKTHDPLRVLKNTAWGSLCVLLLIGLPGQYLFYNLDTLVSDPRYDSITSMVCGVFECPDNQVIDLANLVTEELDVRTHPTRDDALQVNFIFRNDAAREQRFPLVELNFTDISGEILANRVFTRDEYLPPEMELFTHMPAHSSIQVSLELVDPGSQATGYSLVFRNP